MSEASEPVDRRQRIRHRVVGAAVLAALAVIMVPVLLDIRGNDDAVITRTNIPERPQGFRVVEIPLTPEIVTLPGTSPESAAGAGTVTGAPADDPQEGAAPSPPPAAVAEPPEALPQAFAVQIGSFSSEENAAALRDRLRGNGYSAFLDRATVDGRTVIRVLVGPDARREHSERLRDRIDSELSLKGVVVGYD
jgi:DedD protein